MGNKGVVEEANTTSSKLIIYQIFTRLFGNDNANRKISGSIQENGCGKFADITPQALRSIRRLGATHVWFTGVIAHSSRTDYSAYGIPGNHPAIVKGEAGSPYAIRDYYDVDPDLAVDPALRMSEYEALIQRTHEAGLGVIMDFVPNHVSRQYHSAVCPKGITDLGADDDKDKAFDPQNNFYYMPGTPLQGSFDMTAGASEAYAEIPARATGNDRFDPYPEVNDWYETVKLNYGVDYCGQGTSFDPLPDTWKKMLQILLYWAGKGVDAFRCDMAEMVPAEFWHYAIAEVKKQYPSLSFIAEIYNPAAYRHYISFGGFDYLYDKVGLYDTLRAVCCGYAPARNITGCWQSIDGIQSHMLNFLENHDEQRIASDFFAGDARKAIPALLVSATMHTSPFMLYFGQEWGERGMDAEGFSGLDGRTTIFDYWSLDAMTRWKNGGKYSENLFTPEEAELRQAYARLLNLCTKEKAISEGTFYDLMYVNPDSPVFDDNRQYAYLRRSDDSLLLIIANFSDAERTVQIRIPEHAFDFLQIPLVTRPRKIKDLLSGDDFSIVLHPDIPISVSLPAYGGRILKIRVSRSPLESSKRLAQQIIPFPMS